MSSFASAQASALAEGFLDSIGGSKEEFQPRDTLSQLFILAGELIEDAQNNLNADRSNASGNLSDSIQARDPVASNGIIQIDIEMLFYGQFVNKGVKGTKSGQGLYSFKYDMPSRDMVTAFQQYMRSARAKIGNVKSPIGHEIKNKAVSDISSAFAMARATKQHGIKATGFMDKAIDTTNAKVQDKLGNALAIDVLNALPDKLN